MAGLTPSYAMQATGEAAEMDKVAAESPQKPPPAGADPVSGKIDSSEDLDVADDYNVELAKQVVA